jgi:hypothetical protein
VGTAGKIAIGVGAVAVLYLLFSRASSSGATRTTSTGATGGNKPSDVATTAGLLNLGASLINSLKTPTTQSPPSYGGSPNLWSPGLSSPANYHYTETVNPFLSAQDATTSDGVVDLQDYEVYGPAAPT